MSKSSEQDQAYKSYMLESINTLCMGSDAITNEELAAYVYETFESEYQHETDRYGRQKAFSNWLAGLPTVLTIAFTNHDILKLAVKFKSIPKDYTEKQADKILTNYFTFMAVKFLQCVDGYRIPTDSDEAMLARVEAYQEDTNGIDSEEALSSRFDSFIDDISAYDRTILDDGPMMRECFNNWTDSLCRDGELHPLQYHQYCNIGKYAHL